MRSVRLALLLVTSLSGLVFACSAPLDPKASASRDSVTSCEPDTDVACRCANGTSGKKHCDEDGTLGECSSHNRACGNGSKEGDGLTPTPTSPLTPGPTKPDPGAEPPDEPPPPGTPPPPTSTCSAESEPNNTNDAADGIATKRCGTLTASDEDIFWWNGAGSFEVTLTATGNADIVVWQDVVGGTYFPNASPTRVVGTAAAGSDILISVISQTQQSQSYTLTLKR